SLSCATGSLRPHPGSAFVVSRRRQSAMTSRAHPHLGGSRQMTPVPTPETRLAYSSTAPRRVAVREFGAAAFLFVRDHNLLGCHLDQERNRIVWHFAGTALADYQKFLEVQDHLFALRDRTVAAANKRAARSGM